MTQQFDLVYFQGWIHQLPEFRAEQRPISRCVLPKSLHRDSQVGLSKFGRVCLYMAYKFTYSTSRQYKSFQIFILFIL